jgi:hypothetical protein
MRMPTKTLIFAIHCAAFAFNYFITDWNDMHKPTWLTFAPC